MARDRNGITLHIGDSVRAGPDGIFRGVVSRALPQQTCITVDWTARHAGHPAAANPDPCCEGEYVERWNEDDQRRAREAEEARVNDELREADEAHLAAPLQPPAPVVEPVAPAVMTKRDAHKRPE